MSQEAKPNKQLSFIFYPFATFKLLRFSAYFITVGARDRWWCHQSRNWGEEKTEEKLQNISGSIFYFKIYYYSIDILDACTICGWYGLRSWVYENKDSKPEGKMGSNTNLQYESG